MIPRKFRIRILRRAQAAGTGPGTGSASATTSPASPASPASPTSPTAAAIPIANIDVRSIPLFKTNLFSVFPRTINDLNLFINKVNRYMLMLGDKKVGFSEVYTNPSVSGSNFVNSLKNLLNLSKWLYKQMIVDRAPYTTNDLKKIYSDMIASLNQYSFPEPTMTNTQNDLVLTAKRALANIGP